MYRMMLFDVDGVLLSEQRYFDASALTVWEMIHSSNYLGIDQQTFTASPQEELIRKVRHSVFAHDETLRFIKGRGINANWDMVYLTFAYQIIRLLQHIQKNDDNDNFVKQILTQPIDRNSLSLMKDKAQNLQHPMSIDYQSFTMDFERSQAEKQALLFFLNDIAYTYTGIETNVFSRKSILWDICQETFQEWYLGDEKIEQSIGKKPIQVGKKGFLNDEIPIVEPKKMAHILQQLKDKGIILGIGTGRPEIETIEPLKSLGLLSYFDSNRIISATHVLDTERMHPEHSPLAKPQPFCYSQGYLGKDQPAMKAIELSLPLVDADQVLIIGDSLADYMAAQSMGCHFAVTLTGLTGQEARSKFEELHADYILNDAGELLDILPD